MPESEAEAIWSTVQEFVRAMQRRDPTVRRWLAPQSEAELLLDIYGEESMLTLLKDYLEKETFIFLRTAPLPKDRGPARLAEIAWIDPGASPPTRQDRVTLQLRQVRRRWLVEDLWPAPLDAPMTVDQARAAWFEHEDRAEPAAIFLAGAAMTPPEGCGELDDVETLFVLGMDAHGFSPREVVRAVRLWRDLCRAGRPLYRRPAILAAAVEYTFSLLGAYMGNSLRRTAAYYGVQPNSLGRRFAMIRDRLNLVCFDPRYSAFEPPAELWQRWRDQGLAGAPPLGPLLDKFWHRQQP